MRFLTISFPIFLCLAGTAWPGEYAVLAGGGRLHIDRHEIAEGKVTLYLGAGTIELDASEVQGFEPDETVPAAQQVAASVPAPPPALSPEQLADVAARKYGLPPHLVRSVMKAESGFQQQAVSPKGALGLMQLMPGTAQTLGADPHDAAQNVDAGTRYLRSLLEKYGGALRHALAAYNAGPGTVERYGGVPPFAETLEYIRRVERNLKGGE
jgi:soluble lytic murein transglycosylase-like protein